MGDSRRQEIRIPTFGSPIPQAAPTGQPKTRDEERKARLKGPAGQWNDFGSLFRGLAKLPDHLLDPAAAAAATTTSTSTTSTKAATLARARTASASPTKRRESHSQERPEPEQVEPEPEEEQGEPVDDEPQPPPSLALDPPSSKGKAKEKQQQPSPTRKSSIPSPKLLPEPADDDQQQQDIDGDAEMGDSSFEKIYEEAPEEEEVPEVLIPEEEEERPVAKKPTSPAKKPSKTPAMLKKAAPPPPPPPKEKLKKKRAPPVLEEEEEDNDNDEPHVPVAGPSKLKSQPAKRPTKKPKKTIERSPSPVPLFRSPSPSLSVASDPEPAAAESDQDDDEASNSGSEEEDGDGTKTKKGGTQIRSERLRTNKGKLNAIDVAYGRLSRLVKDKMATTPTVKSSQALHRYSTLLQLHLLNHSDQISTLATRTSQVSQARTTAKQLRADLLGVQRARAGVGRRLATEEAGWRASRKRVESTRRLHAFLGDLSGAALDLNAAAGTANGSIKEAVEPRLRRLVAMVGRAGADGKGRLLGRVEALNHELERV